MSRPERMLVSLLRQLCEEEGIAFTALGDGRTLRLARAGQIRHVYGFHLELNSATAQLIANDKVAAYNVLAHCGVPAVEHRQFLRPGAGSEPDTPGSEGNWRDIFAFFCRHDQDLVCKISTATGGDSVTRVQSPAALEHAVHRLFAKSRSISLSPYIEIREEYRVIMFEGRPLLTYAKERPCVIGDGQRSLFELMLADYPDYRPGRLSERLQYVPALGEKILLNWKHNLGRGARARLLEDPVLCGELHALAVQAAQALGIRFASVDIVAGPAGLAVLEINAGIMMERFARQGEREYAIALGIYRQALREMMKPTLAEPIRSKASASLRLSAHRQGLYPAGAHPLHRTERFVRDAGRPGKID